MGVLQTEKGWPVVQYSFCAVCVCVCLTLVFLARLEVLEGRPSLTLTFGVPNTSLMPGSHGGSRNIADGLICSQGIW